MQNGIHRQQSLKEKLKSSMCCFSGSGHELESGEGFLKKLGIPKTPNSPLGSTQLSSWVKLRTPLSNDLAGEQTPRVRSRSLRSRMGRKLHHHRQSQSADFSYDPSSYALNFENDSPQQIPFRNFSSRLPLSPLPSPSPVQFSGQILACT